MILMVCKTIVQFMIFFMILSRPISKIVARLADLKPGEKRQNLPCNALKYVVTIK